MIAMLFHVTVKAGREAEWREMLTRLTQSTRAEDDGCITYQYYQQSDSQREYVLFEQWRERDALLAHIARLANELGRVQARVDGG